MPAKSDGNFKTLKNSIKYSVRESLFNREDEVYRKIIDVAEVSVIESALELTYGNQLKAAKVLGINRNTLRES